VERLPGVGVAALLGRVDEVQRHISGDERQLGDRLHTLSVPAKMILLV
jgi:hypothetical protein